MSSMISPLGMPLIQNLFEQRKQALRLRMGNLQIVDVQNDEAYERTLNSLIETVVLREIIFSDFIIGDHRMISKQFPANFNFPMPHTKDVYIFSVQKPFTGSQELFKYSPEGYSFSSSDTGVYQPTGNAIHLEIEVEEFSKELVLRKAEAAMRTTQNFIAQINPQAINWSNAITEGLKSRLVERRTELLRF